MVNHNPLYTQYLMDKCGVAWFKMNESAGNLMDSKGSFVGVNNSTSVVSGFSGNGRSFNGTSSYISFPSGMIPLGRKSVRFKIKLSTEGINNYSWILSSGHNGESSFNILLDFRSASKGIRFTLRDASGTTGEIYTIVTNYFVDNQWHDYLFTWDGTTNVSGVKVYCDGIISSTETAKKNETAIINKPLILGNIPALGSAEYFNGQLDELEIYNDVIQPVASKILLSSGGKYYSVLNDGIQETTSIPKMTSNTTPEGEVFVSNTPNGSFTMGWESFDGGLTNGWGNNNLPGSMPRWIGYKFTKPKVIVKYRLYVTNTTYYPRNYEFQGSNDGINYDTLHSVVGGVSGVLDYVIPNRKSYIYYRLYITLLSSGATLPAIMELQMFEMKPSYLVQMESATETDFLNRGVGDLNDFNQILKTKKNLKKGNTVLGSGKTFEHTVDMSKRRVDKITLG